MKQLTFRRQYLDAPGNIKPFLKMQKVFYNKLNQGNLKKADNAGESHDISQELINIKGHTKAFFSKTFLEILENMAVTGRYMPLASSSCRYLANSCKEIVSSNTKEHIK